ncbi:MAG TPA: hypothetical protein VHC69_33765 [Polyangiaceae bacterium]|nr:hypothetical protein [Polyangiaceae bacterium]
MSTEKADADLFVVVDRRQVMAIVGTDVTFDRVRGSELVPLSEGRMDISLG